MKRDKRRQQRIITLTIVAFVLLAVIVVALDWSEVRQIAGKANWEMTVIALVFTCISYLCLSSGYVVVNRVFGVKIAWGELFEVGVVSTTLNNILAFAGAAGHSLRLALIRRQGVATGGILAASMFHSYLNNVMMLLLWVIGFISLLISHTFYGGGAVGLYFITGALVLSLIVGTAVILLNPLRLFLLHVFNAVSRLVIRRDLTQFLVGFNNALTQGMLELKNRRRELILLLGLMGGDWAFAAIALHFCFNALGNAPGFAILLTGFGTGISVGNLSMVPGGLGVQEASMAGVYALLGISFTQAVLASILFRVVYDFIPFFGSLVMYRRLLKRQSKR